MIYQPRFLGADVPGFEAGNAEFQVPTSDLSPAYSLSERGKQDLQNTFNRVRQEQDRNTQVYIESQGRIADMAKAYAVADQVQRQSSASGFSDLANAVQGIAQTYLRFRNQQAEAEAAKAKADQEAEDRAMKLQRFEWEVEDRDIKREDRERERRAAIAWLAANEQSEKLLNTAPQVLQGEGGVTEYERLRVDLLKQYLPYLKPEQGVELIRRLQDPVQKERDRRFNEQQQYIEKESAAIEERDIEQGLFYLNAKAGLFIKHANSPEALEKSTQEYMSLMQQTAEKLPPITRAKFIADAFNNLSKQVDLGQGQFLELRSQLENYQMFTAEAAREYAKLQQQGATYLPQYRANIGYLRKRFGVSDSAGFDNPFEADDRMDTLRRRQESLDEAFRKQELTAIERTNVTYDEVVSLAYLFYADPRQRDVFEKYLNNPKIKSAITLADDIKKYDSLVSTNNEKKSRLRQELIRLEASDLKQWLSWVQSDAGDDLLAELGIRSKVNDTIERIVTQSSELSKKDPTWLEKLSAKVTGKDPSRLTLDNLAVVDPNENVLSSSDVTPQEIQAIRQQVQQLNGVIKGEVERQMSLVDNDPEYIRLRSVLSSYKMLQPNQRAAQAKVASTRTQQVIERIQKNLEAERARAKASMLPQTGDNSSSPEYPFNLPRMEMATIRGNRIITPFKAGTSFTFTSDYKDARPGGRLHAGSDFAAPIGTPLHFYDYGVVDYVGNVSGYGKLVDIKTRDGKIHRFAHLNGYNVKQGQKVTPGMLFAKTGNTDGGTGISTGPHLHWEIRNSAFGGFESSVDVVKHMAQYRNGTGKINRNGDVNPRHAPFEAIRGKGGSFIQDGRVWANDKVYGVKYSVGSPFKNAYASPFLGDYYTRKMNNDENNYGYKFLAENHAFRKKLHQVAKNIGIPAMWLVDIMAHESGFSASIQNMSHGNGATGLIQFMPETARSLGTSVEELSRMNPVKQLDYVQKYFTVNGFAGKMKNIYAVLQAIWNGSIDRANRLDPSLRTLTDGTVTYFPEEGVSRTFTFEDYVKRLGRDVGRQYKPYSQKGIAIHLGYKDSCTTCQSIKRSGEKFFPHEAS